MGLMSDLYSFNSVRLSIPNVVPDNVLSMFSLFYSAFVVVIDVCALKVSALSSVTPGNLASSEALICLLLRMIGLGWSGILFQKRTN